MQLVLFFQYIRAVVTYYTKQSQNSSSELLFSKIFLGENPQTPLGHFLLSGTCNVPNTIEGYCPRAPNGSRPAPKLHENVQFFKKIPGGEPPDPPSLFITPFAQHTI